MTLVTGSAELSIFQSDQLFCSKDGLLRVIDIPLSIAQSQNLDEKHELERFVYSTPALDTPYQSTEPKSHKARANVLARVGLDTQKRNREYAEFIRAKLEEIKQLYKGPWSALRCTGSSSSTSRQLKRKFGVYGPVKSSKAERSMMVPLKLCKLKDDSLGSRLSMKDLSETLIYNASGQASTITGVGDEGEETIYWIPPLSMVCNMSIDKGSVLRFEIGLEELYSRPSITAEEGQLDIILMDPPWTNRSVLRSDQYSTLDTKQQGQDPLTTVTEALPRLLAAEGILAIWVTNKASSSQRAFEIFKDLDIEVVEEWIWIKVTTTGKPVYDLDGIYRQPWETCLVGRRGAFVSDTDRKKSRRLIVACPDLHSRKPAIGRMLVDHYNAEAPTDLRKLEIFARYASAGWCAWGDEALKFNNQAYWTRLPAGSDEALDRDLTHEAKDFADIANIKDLS